MLWGIQRPSYWRDEAATLAAVRRPFGGLIAMLSNVDAVHGVYYMMIWVVVRLFGTGELATRLPSALAMAAASAGVGAIGWRLVSPRAGLLAGLVLAALPQVSWYGQDARSYAMVMALATTASYLLVRLLGASGPRRGWLAAYGLALTAVGLVNIFGLLLIPAHGLTVALALRHGESRGENRQARRSLLAGWLAAAAAACAAASPLIAAAWEQRAQEHWLKTPGIRMLAALRYLVGPSALVAAVLLTIGSAIAVSAVRGRARARADWPARIPALCLPWLLLPATVLLAGSLIQPVYTLRYVLFSLPALALLAGTALASLRPAAGAIALAIVMLIGLPAQVQVRSSSAHGDNIRMADDIVAAAMRPGDAVLYASAAARNMAAAYPEGLAALRNIALARAPVPTGTLAGTYWPAAAVRRQLAHVRRTWVVQVGGTSPQRLPLLAGAGFRLVRSWRPSGIWLLLYQHRNRPYYRHREPRRVRTAAVTRRSP
jgi:mannosyltransferase